MAGCLSIDKVVNKRLYAAMKLYTITLIFLSQAIVKVQGLFGWHPKQLIPLRGGSSINGVRGPVMEYEGNDGPPQRILIVMDCFCPYHGHYLAARAKQYPGVAVVFVLSDYLRGYLQTTDSHPDSCEQWEAARIPAVEEVEEWKARLGEDVELVGVYCESDSGLADAERLRFLLGVRCQDHPVTLEARRHKFMMNEKIGQEGMAVVKQRLCDSLKDAQDFAKSFLDTGERVVVKPYRGVATESVYLCDDLDQVNEAWEKIFETTVFGSHEKHNSCLLQEFLTGTEYAVDVVSRDGQHKVAAIWRYDKRPANGSAFCYFRTELVDADTDANVAAVVDYVEKSLAALGVRWGLSHNEVIVTSNKGAVLVEINCRQHNMDFCPLTMACIGYNALDMTLDSFLGDEEAWENYPDLPELQAFGCMVHLVNYKSGTLVQNQHVDTLKEMPSVLDFEIYSEFSTPGVEIKPTIDIRSDAGWVQLINLDRNGLEEDYSKIVDLMPSMFQVDALD